ncbi:MAG: redox-sensing transcriptional repressor Rex [Acidimicrobiales bacterium]
MIQPAEIPQATVARLPLYLRALAAMTAAGATTVSSKTLAARTGVNGANVRKDLAHLGTLGTRGAGYGAEVLLGAISSVLGVGEDRPLVIVGVGNLGRALAQYEGFSSRGFRVAGLFDTDPSKAGEAIAGVRIADPATLECFAGAVRPVIGVIAVPGYAAQNVADLMVAVGIASILNFAPSVIQVPEGVLVRQVDLATELQILGFYHRHRELAPEPGPQAQPGSESQCLSAHSPTQST